MATIRSLLIVLTISACAAAPNPVGQVIVVETLVANTSPETIEREIARPLERALGTLPGVKEIKSTSTYGACRVEIGYQAAPTLTEVEQVEVTALVAWKKFSLLATRPTLSIGPSGVP